MLGRLIYLISLVSRIMTAVQQRLRPARNRILHTAARLFYARGLVATGIDTITAEAQVAKMSLYNNFASKDELELAYIAARHQELLEFYHQRLAQAPDPLGRVLAMLTRISIMQVSRTKTASAVVACSMHSLSSR